MKKLLLLLIFIGAFGAFGAFGQTVLANKLRITGNVTDNVATKVNVQATDGTVNTIAKIDLQDILSFVNEAGFPITGLTGKLYFSNASPTKLYKWNGTVYIEAGGGTIIDATTTIKGIVKLAGDLGGTADLPTTPTAVHKSGDESITGQKVFINNSTFESNIFSQNNFSGIGITSNGSSSATGFNYIGQNNGVNTFTVDKFGSVTADTNTGAPNEVVRNVDLGNKFIPLTGTTNPVTGDIVSQSNLTIGSYLYTGGGSGILYDDGGEMAITHSYGISLKSNNSGISITGDNLRPLKVTSPNSLSQGIGSDQDYSLNITDLDYTQKIYVDTKVLKGVNNATTVVLTSAQLNTQYPTATAGFRVYCTSIIAGSMVYEKTATQWIGMTVFIP